MAKSLNQDEQAFFRAIEAADEDDTPRLVYADWLEERGNADRARFIRLQVAFHQSQDQTERETLYAAAEKLSNKHAKTWLDGLPDWMSKSAYFFRGFPSLNVLRAQLWLRDIEHLRTRMPVGRIAFLSLGDIAEQVFTSPFFADVRDLTISNCRLTEPQLQALTSSRFARELRNLDIGRFSGNFSREDNQLTDHALHLLADSKTLRSLRSLDVSGYFNKMTTEGFRRLLESKNLARLEHLFMGRGPGGLELTKLFTSDTFQLRKLRTLGINNRDLDDAALDELAKSPYLGKLTQLNLSDNKKLSRESLLNLIRSGRFKSLHSLALSNNAKLTNPKFLELLKQEREWKNIYAR